MAKTMTHHVFSASEKVEVSTTAIRLDTNCTATSLHSPRKRSIRDWSDLEVTNITSSALIAVMTKMAASTASPSSAVPRPSLTTSDDTARYVTAKVSVDRDIDTKRVASFWVSSPNTLSARSTAAVGSVIAKASANPPAAGDIGGAACLPPGARLAPLAARRSARKYIQRGTPLITESSTMARIKQKPQKTSDKPDKPGLKEKKFRKFKGWRPGTKALREIRAQQKKTELAIPKAAFRRLVAELVQKIEAEQGIRLKRDVYEMLQTASEDYLIDIFRDGQALAIEKGAITLSAKDLRRAVRTQREISSRIIAMGCY